jgi:hypothetical protein
MFEVVSRPEPSEDERYRMMFFVHGFAHRTQEEQLAPERLRPGDALILRPDQCTAAPVLEYVGLQRARDGGLAVGLIFVALVAAASRFTPSKIAASGSGRPTPSRL